MSQHNKTEPATPRRKQKAREKGQVPRSRELSSALALLAGALVIWWLGKAGIAQWNALFRRLLAVAGSGEITDATPILKTVATAAAYLSIPVLAAVWMAALCGTLAQGGLVFAPAALAPNSSRFNPAENIRKLLSVSSASGVLKSLFPLGALLYLFASMLARDWPDLARAGRLSPHGTASWLAAHSYEIAWKSGLIFLAWAGIDFMLQRFNFNRQLRMSQQELRDEHKEMEGNPQIKGRVRRLQRSMRRKNMLRDVAQASVVITNPEHYAVALRYQPELTPAPIVVAKGRNLFAQQIREQARWNNIPIAENPALARALYKAVEVGGEIPAKFYAAVAEVLAFIFRAQAEANARAARHQAQQIARALPAAPDRGASPGLRT